MSVPDERSHSTGEVCDAWLWSAVSDAPTPAEVVLSFRDGQVVIERQKTELLEKLFCQECGEPFTCPDCLGPMVHHDMFGMAWCQKIMYRGSHD